MATSREIPRVLCVGTRPELAAHGQLRLTVVATRLKETAAALEHARKLARDLHASIRILVPRIVPFHNSLEEPPVSASIIATSLLSSLPAGEIEPNITICFCRDEKDVWATQIEPRAIVIAGSPRRFLWPQRGTVNTLRELGHQVIIAEE